MEEVQAGALLSPTTLTDEATAVLKAQVVDAIVARLRRGEAVKRLAAEYEVDPKTIRPWRVAARQRATIRFETAPGRQAQVDFGQRQVWIADRPVIAHVFVFTLGYSRRCYVEAFRHERLEAVLTGHEHAFHHFAGVPEQ